MAEEKQEAKEVEVKEPVNVAEETREEAGDIMDKLLDDHEAGKETPAATSTEEKTTGDETEKPEESTSEPDTAKKEDEPGKETKDPEGEIPEEFHKHPAWIKQREKAEKAELEAEELRSKLSDKQLTDVEKVTSSAEFIRAKMEKEGYKEETIQVALNKAGHKAPVKQQDMMDTVIEQLGYKKEDLTQEQLDYIHDISKVAGIVSGQDPALSERLDSIEATMQKSLRDSGADDFMATVNKTVTDEGILDYKIDIEPKLHKFLDENPEAKQADVLNHFKDINHQLVLERGTLAKKKVTRDEQKSVLNQNTHSVGKAGVTVPTKTGDPNADADAFLDAMGVHT